MEFPKQPWSITASEVVLALESLDEGLPEKEAEKRLRLYGNNTFHTKEKVGVVSLFLKQFFNPLIFLLVGAGILTGVLAEWLDTFVIGFAVLLNAGLGFYHEYHAENTLDKLTTFIKDRARVKRSGREQEVDSSLLVPGDIIKLSYGSRVPADARIISENNFRVDEAILTGEALPVEKVEDPMPVSALVAERGNIAHAGTLVVQGYATAVVYATGNSTEIGKIAGIVSKTGRTKTPLLKGVNRMAWFIFAVVLVLVTAILFLGLSRGEPFIQMLLLSAAVAVGAVPEALPIALTVILAIGSERIASKKGIVRKLTAAETLGSTSVIMTDKTGTLTLADMQLVGIQSAQSILNGKSDTLDPKEFSHEQKSLLTLSLANVDVSVENPHEDEKNWNFRGRPFEVNIVKAARLHGVSLDKVASADTALMLPFNSTDKFSIAQSGDMYVVMGAPDILLRRANISKEDFIKLEEWIDRTSHEGKRILGLATFERDPKKHAKKHIVAEEAKDLKFLGMLVFYDPIRPEVPEAIKNIESHGIKIVLVTGDLRGTALAVAKSLDWNVHPDEVLSGGDIRAFSDEELLVALPKTKIFARVTPEDKLRIGQLYQKLGEVVAMTGDGVNDAPALKAMDIGISLGGGSDVAKSASDLVLLDDNLATINLAIDEGRRILANIRKTFVYLMSNSYDVVFMIGGSLLFSLPLPITALQIIWVNLFTGSLPALSFAFDEDIDRDKNSGKDLKLIFTKEVKVITFGIGLLSSGLLFALYYFLLKIGLDFETVKSVFFVCFSSYILAITFSFRSLHRPLFTYPAFSNKKLNYSVLIAVLILIATVTIPAMQNIFGLGPMPLSWLPFILFWLVLNVLLIEGAKFVMRKKHIFLRAK